MGRNGAVLMNTYLSAIAGTMPRRRRSWKVKVACPWPRKRSFGSAPTSGHGGDLVGFQSRDLHRSDKSIKEVSAMVHGTWQVAWMWLVQGSAVSCRWLQCQRLHEKKPITASILGRTRLGETPQIDRIHERV